MKICFLCISLRSGGTEKVISTIANRWASSHDIQIVLVTRSKPFYQLDSRITVSIPKISRSNGLSLTYYLKMLTHVRSAIKRHRSEVVFSFGETLNPFFLLSTLFLGVPKKIVLNRASPWSSLKGFRGILNPIVYPLATRVVVQTNSAKSTLSRRYRFCNFAVIANPVTLPKSIPAICERENVIISVGSLGGRKNQEALIRAFACVAPATGWALRIVGDGPNRETLERLCMSLKLQDQIQFLGERKDVSELLLDSQVFAFTSLSEGFPNALAEGLAHGCACISFDCPTGPADLIRHESNGLLIPMTDEDLYAQQLRRLVDDADLRSRLSKRAILDMQKYSPDKIIGQFEQLI